MKTSHEWSFTIRKEIWYVADGVLIGAIASFGGYCYIIATILLILSVVSKTHTKEDASDQ